MAIIIINGSDISTNFDDIRSMFGYCPQFDAIFEYMTVYENLEFVVKEISKTRITKLRVNIMKLVKRQVQQAIVPIITIEYDQWNEELESIKDLEDFQSFTKELNELLFSVSCIELIS